MKVIGVGLNKTGTKTLAAYLEGWGMRHRSYDYEAFRLYLEGNAPQILESMKEWDSFEDWPWPLIWREIDERFPDARFVLTVRESPEVWYRSLCGMAVRRGPFKFEKHIYGYLDFYRTHNQAVTDHFRNRPNKLITICWTDSNAPERLAEFLGQDLPNTPPVHENRGIPVYSGDNLFVAQAYRVAFQRFWQAKKIWRRLVGDK